MGSRKTVEDAPSKRAAILAAARKLFVKKGYEETTIADIASAANVAVGTVYLYFRNKRDIYTGMAIDIEAMIADAFDDPYLLTIPFAQIPKTLVDALFAVGRAHMKLIAFLQIDIQSDEELLQHKHVNDRLCTSLETIFQLAIERGELAPFNTAMYAQMLNLLGENIMHQCFAVENGEREAMYHTYFLELSERLFFGPSLQTGYPQVAPKG
ncbi:hypothetical protein KDA_62390 [Dictyobacter alpinus]|uniref:HTH tetR-type domain-containing protein n=1 Tax=Dictyobacter alpinus TaxID=2014873 RepID=A0A402BHA6_9CHLR|nr:TetR/AcrR family transcriptional regulator [Dictyobacter alpinus]GCE30755.1 hypothetical protein KDA_62390 [Dictyobacter alpinus]